MRNEVIVKLPGADEISLPAADPLSLEQARIWLDQEFGRLECVVTRPTGKVLFADKLLGIAQAADTQGFADAAWATQYARAAAGALGRPFIRIDVDAATVGS